MMQEDPVVVLGESRAAEAGARVLFREARHHHVMTLHPERDPRPRFLDDRTLHVDDTEVPFAAILLAPRCAPHEPYPVLDPLEPRRANLDLLAGRVVVDGSLRARGNPWVFVAGPAAWTPHVPDRHPMAEARRAAWNLVRSVEGGQRPRNARKVRARP